MSSLGESVIAQVLQVRKSFFISLFVVFTAVALLVGFVLEKTGVLQRSELQAINRRFEARPWLVWAPESLRRLNLQRLWDYHERHEIPRDRFHWDWTFSWLIENNHPPVINHIVIFNRTPEDEPPDEAVQQFPWMQPLRHYPLPRQALSQMVDFLAQAGAAAIILDNDFPQHSDGDSDMANVIHKWSTVGQNGRRVPILMVSTVNSGSDSHVMELGVPTRPSGILTELKKLEPNTDVDDKFTGMTCVSQDRDQVVRGIFLKLRPGDKEYQSVIVKLLDRLGRKLPADLPAQEMDIDYGCPPRSDLYPTRSLTYLLDPDRKAVLLNPEKSKDVDVRGAIVFIGDGLTDVYSTPLTNEGNNQMSGTEILAHGLETVSRHSWPTRAGETLRLLYLAAVSVLCGLFWVSWKAIQMQTISRLNDSSGWVMRLLQDLCVCALMLTVVHFAPCLIFVWFRLLVPMMVPPVALGFAALAAILLERENEREEKFQLELKAADEKLSLTREKYEAEIKRREAEARTREMLLDKKRRHEFVRRINHDLNAPVSVLNWTVAELQMMELGSDKAKEKVSRLVKSSDKLCELIDQLVQSYDYETVPSEINSARTLCDLASVVHDSVDGQMPLATINSDSLLWQKPDKPMWVKANQLELTRVVDNIIRNAIKHNQKGTEIRVHLDSNGAFYLVSIADNGKGIAPEHLSKIFQPGFRVEPSKKDGQGLGLDIAKTLIEGVGGEIVVDSTVNKGTTFTLKVPICSEEEVAVAKEHEQNDAADNGSSNGSNNGHEPLLSPRNGKSELVETTSEMKEEPKTEVVKR